MTFKWKIIRPSFQGVAANIEVMHPGIEVEFETGSIGEAHGIFSDNGTALSEMFGGSIMANASALASDIDGAQGDQAPVETDAERKKRERKEKKNNGNPTTATAPDPVVIPGVEAPPTAPVAAAPLNTAPGANGIPAFLDRTGTAAAPPTPPPPAAPPAPPAAPPTGVLAGKIAAAIEEKVIAAIAAGDATAGQKFADWLATSGIVVKGATYSEAVTVLRLQADEKLGPIAQALGVPA